jgi:spermidine synthase
LYRIVFLFFFLSGFSSLVFEVIWARMLMQVFGTTSFAISTLLTAFMAGLALGSVIGGRLARRLTQPLQVYAILEGSIGLYALLVPIMLGFLPALYGMIFEHFIEDFYLFSLLRFVAVFAILFIPTTMMGATLPIVSQWLTRHERMFQGSIGLLYGANTLGACLGCFLAGFVLLPAMGLSKTNLIFALVNFALCAFVLVSVRLLRREFARTEETFEGSEVDPELAEELEVVTGSARHVESLPSWATWTTLAFFGLTGIVAMSYQVLWTRAYVIVLGSSTYSFTLVLTAVLIGIALGSAIISPLVKRMSRPVYWLALTQFGVCASATISFFVLDRLPAWLMLRVRDTIGSAAEIFMYNFLLVGLVVLLPSMLQGMSFPLVVRAVVHDRERSGKEVGRAYAFNTAGAIIGSFAAGFVLMPWLGLQKAISLIIGINLFIGFALAMCELVSRREKTADPRAMAALMAAAIAAGGVFVFAPSIDRVRLTAGMFRVYWAREVYTPDKLQRDNPELLYYKDGLTATTSVERRGGLVTLKANGKPEASDGADMSTQVLVGILPFIIRSGFETAELGREQSVMVGFGSGVTAGASLQWPLEHLEVIEIEKAMVEASRFFDHVNNRPLDDPRMRLIESDGRNFLEYSRKTYDVIVSEPSNPWIAGVSSLFTVEHFERVKRKLDDDGVFAQWVQLYELRPENVQRIFATFMSVFDHVQAFSSKAKSTDLILIGSHKPIVMPPEGWQRAWEIDTVRAELERIGIEAIEDLYGLMFMNQQEMEAFARGAALNTDDNGLLEFEAPKDLILYWVGDGFFADLYFRSGRYGDPRPYLEAWRDESRWGRSEVAALARAQWLAGKPLLARDILEEMGYPIANLEHHDGDVNDSDALDTMRLVLFAEALDLGPTIAASWPVEDSRYQAMVRDLLRGASPAHATMLLHSTKRPERDGYSGEMGLYYAFVLSERNYYRNALDQLDRLRREGDPALVDSVPFQLLDGFIQGKRRRYGDAYEAYKKAGRLLMEQTALEAP